jgi:hypothetical protein
VTVWDWPGDTREAKLKRVAHSYRDLAVQLATVIGTDEAKDALLDLDALWLERDQHWIRHDGDDPYDPEEWITAADAAHYLGVKPGTIRKWAERKRNGCDGIMERTGADRRRRYNVADLKQYAARRRIW